MGELKILKNQDDLAKYIKSKKLKCIGDGSEGEAYLTNDNMVIKKYVPELCVFGLKKINRDIITKKKLDLESFLFPYELYIYDKYIMGYKTDYFYNVDYDLEKIDLKKLIEAREKMIEDIRVITDMGYNLYEMPFNLLFNGSTLKAIETIEYRKQPGITLDDNIETLDYALTSVLNQENSEYEFKPKNLVKQLNNPKKRKY